MNMKYIWLALVMACAGCNTENFDSEDEPEGIFESHINDDKKESKEPSQEVKDQAAQADTIPIPEHKNSDEKPQEPRPQEGAPKELPPLVVAEKESPVPRGHCDNDQNRMHFFAGNHEFAENLFLCVDQGWTTADLNMSRIAEIYPEMTRECHTCFETYTKCTASNCKRHCRPTWTGGPGERSKPCKKCAWKYCADAMEKCTGFPRTSLPDFKR